MQATIGMNKTAKVKCTVYCERKKYYKQNFTKHPHIGCGKKEITSIRD